MESQFLLPVSWQIEIFTASNVKTNLIFTAKNFLTCEWEPAVKEASYDAEAAEDYNEDASSQQRVNVKKQVLQLKECLEVFTSVERLGADDAWYVFIRLI